MKICIQNISSSCHIPYLHTFHLPNTKQYMDMFFPLLTQDALNFYVLEQLK